MHLWILMELAVEAAKPLSMMFEELWQAGEVPADWKRENISLIFKKEQKEEQGITGWPDAPL